MFDQSTSDDTLVNRAKAGGQDAQEAYGCLFSRHQPWVSRMILGQAPSADAEDINQDTFLSGWVDLGHLVNDAAFAGWIRTIAMHNIYRSHRRRGVQREYDMVPASFTEQPDLAQTLQAANSVRFVLSQLDATDQQVLVLRYVDGLNIDELCDALSLRPSAAKMRLKRARDEFKSVYLKS